VLHDMIRGARSDRPAWPLGLLILTIGLFCFGTLREGHHWGGDFSLYVAHARNLAEGRSYADTGYVFNPEYPIHSPRTYPPLYPVMLAPVYAMRGLDFMSFKVLNVCLFLSFLVLTYFLFRRDLSALHGHLLIAALGFLPMFWTAQDTVAPDIAFLFFLTLALHCARRVETESQGGWPLAWGAVTGLAMYSAYAARSVGIVLPVALLLAEFLRNRRVGRVVSAALLIFGVAMVLQSRFFHSDSSYYEMLNVSLRSVIANAVSYAKDGSRIWSNGYLPKARFLPYCLFLPFVALGFWVRLKRGVTIFETFCILYLGLLIVWSADATTARYLMPLIPFEIFYLLVGIETISAWRGARVARLVTASLALSLAFSFVGAYGRASFGPVSGGIRTAGFAELVKYVETQTSPDDVIIFQNPRVLSLFTRHRAAAYLRIGDGEAVWRSMQRLGARYVILSRVFQEDTSYLAPVVRERQDRLDKVYENANFTLYRIEYRKHTSGT
jgi:4-amino-4-deoxy-L-arabinose transferase-like glycosyltransferase